MPTLRAVVFDLDDTLYPERDFAFSGFNAVAAAFEAHLGERGKVAAEMRHLFDTEHRRRVFDVVLERRGIGQSGALIGPMIETYRSHRPSIVLAPDAEALLTRLRPRCRLGLISDGPAVMQQAKVEALGLTDRLDQIILTDELGPGFGKPDPRAFERMMRRLAVESRGCAYVADNAAKDFVAPNALGWTTVQIRRGGGIYLDQPPMPSGVPGRVITTLDDFEQALADES